MSTFKFHVLGEKKEQLTSPFGMRNGTLHKGADFINGSGKSQGDSIVAPFAGVITTVTNDVTGSSTSKPRGNTIIMQLENKDFECRFYHLKKDSVVVKVGQKVKAGQKLALMGYTGLCSPEGAKGTHLHFEIRLKGEPVDPIPYLKGTKPVVKPVAKPPKPANVPNKKYSVLCAALNIRSGPGLTNARVGFLKRGEIFEVLEVENGWGRIAKGQWCSLDPAFAKEAVLYKVTASVLNIRSGPGTQYSDIGNLKRGTLIHVFNASGAWGRIDKDKWCSLRPDLVVKA